MVSRRRCRCEPCWRGGFRLPGPCYNMAVTETREACGGIIMLTGEGRRGPARLFLAGLLVGALAGPARAGSQKPVDFAHDIVPLLKARCAECHTGGKRKGGLSLNTRESIL